MRAWYRFAYRLELFQIPTVGVQMSVVPSEWKNRGSQSLVKPVLMSLTSGSWWMKNVSRGFCHRLKPSLPILSSHSWWNPALRRSVTPPWNTANNGPTTALDKIEYIAQCKFYIRLSCGRMTSHTMKKSHSTPQRRWRRNVKFTFKRAAIYPKPNIRILDFGWTYLLHVGTIL